jgi:hypothetical protein
MSHSRKQHPFAGLTTTTSEKPDKVIVHRRERHIVRQILHTDPLLDILPHSKDFGDSREFGKDGKVYVSKYDHSELGWFDLLFIRLRK